MTSRILTSLAAVANARIDRDLLPETDLVCRRAHELLSIATGLQLMEKN